MIRFACVVMALWLSFGGTAWARRYSLADLVARFEREQPQVLAARAQLAARQAQLLEQQLRWLPEGEARLSLTGAPRVRCLDSISKDADSPWLRLNNCVETNVVDLQRSAPGTSLFDRAPVHGPLFTFSAWLRQPLFTSGKLSAAVAAARGGVGVEEANREAARLDVALRAVQLYAQLKAARAQLATLDEGLAVERLWLGLMEREIDGQNLARYTESDVLRLRVTLANTEAWRLDIRRNVEAGEAALRLLTDDPEADLDEGELVAEPLERVGGDAQDFLDRMRAHRPELLSARAGLRYQAAWRKVQLGFALPDVALATGIGAGASPTFDLPTLGFANLPASSIGAGFALVLRQPLDLGVRIARARQAASEERMQQARFQLGLGYWTLEVEKAWLDAREAARRAEETARAERVAQGWGEAVEANRALGLVGDGREAVEVIGNWLGFRVRHQQAVSDAVIAVANLRRLSGDAALLAGGRP